VCAPHNLRLKRDMTRAGVQVCHNAFNLVAALGHGRSLSLTGVNFTAIPSLTLLTSLVYVVLGRGCPRHWQCLLSRCDLCFHRISK
jgi:hypothetical protein